MKWYGNQTIVLNNEEMGLLGVVVHLFGLQVMGVRMICD